MIERLLGLLGYVKKEKQHLPQANVSGSATEIIKYKRLGKCNWCSRDASWETHTQGNLCNTCHDRVCGLE
jgi:hypothetical protein